MQKEDTKLEENAIKKELYKSKVNAKFICYESGNLYYSVELEDGTYQFPISTIERGWRLPEDDGDEIEEIFLSSDLGTTPFEAEIKASSLNRWIAIAIDREEFLKIA